MSNFIIQLVRTVVPLFVGWLFAQLARLGLHLPAGTDDALTTALVPFLGALYYAAVAWLERRYKWFGWLLGIARRPDYESQGKHAA